MAIDKDIREVKEKLDLLLKRIEALEKLLSMILGSQELVSALGLFRLSGELYRDYSDLSQRIAKAQKQLKKEEIGSDDLMKIILRILIVQGPRNISEITRAIRAVRVKASRGITARKLRKLETMGAIITIKKSSKAKIYDLI